MSKISLYYQGLARMIKCHAAIKFQGWKGESEMAFLETFMQSIVWVFY